MVKLVSLVPKGESKWTAVFDINGEIVEKLVWVHPAEKDVGIGLAMKTVRALKEADRDVAYRKHGDQFRKHCEIKSQFFAALTPEEIALVELSPLVRVVEELRRG